MAATKWDPDEPRTSLPPLEGCSRREPPRPSPAQTAWLTNKFLMAQLYGGVRLLKQYISQPV